MNINTVWLRLQPLALLGKQRRQAGSRKEEGNSPPNKCNEHQLAVAVAVRRSKFSSYFCSFILDGLRGLGQPLHLEPLGGLEELWQLVLRHVHLAGVHELQDCGQVVEGDVLHTGKPVNSEVQLELRLIHLHVSFILIFEYPNFLK